MAREVTAGNTSSLRIEAGLEAVESTVQNAASRIEAGLASVESSVRTVAHRMDARFAPLEDTEPSQLSRVSSMNLRMSGCSDDIGNNRA